jgi:predicted membrane-bound spermidine synthase
MAWVDKSSAPLTGKAARVAAWALYLIVFTSGGVLMGVEIAGSRVLAPNFGTSIFVWGSLIGLFMGAMALGYYVGGSLADKKPSFAVLSTIVSLAGVYTFLFIPYSGWHVCEYVAQQITDRAAGPLLAAGVLFFVPSFLMAMVSPFAIKLNTESLAGVGGVAGKLYALSTAGSIVGTLVTTFALIPLFKVSNVLQGLGVVLLVVAVLALVLFKSAVTGFDRGDRNGVAVLTLIALGCIEVWAIWPVQPHVAAGQRLLMYDESSYHDIAVTENVRWGSQLLPPQGVRRWLKFNEMMESGIFPYRGEYLNAVEYTDVLHLALVWTPRPRSLLVVGGGGGVVPTQFRIHYGTKTPETPAPSLERIDVLELDQKVKDAAEKYFRANGSEFHIGDARMNLRRLQGPYDLILLDAYSAGGQIPFHLLTWEFLKEVKDKLSPNGVLITNIIAAVENEGAVADRPADLLFAEIKTLTAAPEDGPDAVREQLFKQDQVYIFPKVRYGDKLLGREWEYRNVIVFATRQERRWSADEILAAARSFINARPKDRRVPPEVLEWHAKNLYADGPKQADLDAVPVLRDDYAPVDTMYRPIKRDEATWRDN